MVPGRLCPALRKASAARQACLGEHACLACFRANLSPASTVARAERSSIGPPPRSPVPSSPTSTPPVPAATALLAVCLLGMLSACTPRLVPLYRDYEVRANDGPVRDRIEAAFIQAGWPLGPSSAPNVVSTEERTLRNWGLYRVVATLEAVPVGDEYVRLYVHPYRNYFTGNRSKIPFLNGSLRSRLLPALNEAFQEQGFTLVGTPFDRRDGREQDEVAASR